MATVSKGQTFGATETITNTKLHTLVDDATVTGIVNADVSAGAAIAASKLDLTSSGYLTTGENFTITGVYTYSTAPVFSVVPNLPADTIDAITEIKSTLKSGADATLITGTKGTTNYTSKWNADGDLVDGYEVLDEDAMGSDSATKLATQQSIKKYVDDNSGLSNVVASTPRELRASADTEESVGSSQTWEKAKEFTISRAGTYHTSYYNKSGNSSSVYTRIRKNGAVYGTERTHTGTVYAEYTQDLAFVVGDTCELWGKDSPENVCYVKEFRLYTQNEYVSTISD